MTVYAETSAVLRWLFREEHGEQVRATLSRAAKVVTSRLTAIEVCRATRRTERHRRFSTAEAADILAVFAQAAAAWPMLELTEDIARRAEEAFPAEPVRSLDAIHLASALVLRQSLPDLVVVTADERVRVNAAQLGFLAGLSVGAGAVHESAPPITQRGRRHARAHAR